MLLLRLLSVTSLFPINIFIAPVYVVEGVMFPATAVNEVDEVAVVVVFFAF